jgi:hypothetical protein
MPAKDPESRALVAQIAAAERWGRETDRTAATEPMRAGLRAKYAAQVDPDGTLAPAELERRVDHLVHAHMLRMSLAAKKAKAARKTKQAVEAGGPRGAA